MEIRKLFKYSLSYSTESYECSITKELDLSGISKGKDRALITDLELTVLGIQARTSVITELISNDLIKKDDDGDEGLEYKRLMAGLKADLVRARDLIKTDNPKKGESTGKIKEVLLNYDGLEEIDYIRHIAVNLLRA